MISVLTFGSEDGASHSFTDASAVRGWLENADETAATWLFEGYLPLVIHVCSRKLSHSWVADAAQDTMSRAFQSLRNFDPDRSFSSWIATIASRVCVDYLRRYSRSLEIPLDEAAPSALGIPGPDRGENVSAARELVDSLAPDCRALMEAHYFEGLTAREVAERSGLTASNVAIRLMRARQELAVCATVMGIGG